MKRSFLVLSVLFLLVLSGCTVKPAVQKMLNETPLLVLENNSQKIVPVAPQIQQPVLPPIPPPSLVNGKTVQQRLQEAYDRLHTAGSGEHIRASFPDIEKVYVDTPQGGNFPSEILPFTYYYSKEANTTFNICNIDLTVFICQGKLDRLISKTDVENKRCVATPIYLSYASLA